MTRNVGPAVLFDVLLTVHHAMILGNCPTLCTNSFQYIYLFIVLCMFRAVVLVLLAVSCAGWK